MAIRWRIQLLGGLRAEQGDQALAHFQTQKTAVLLAYLAYHLQRAHPREELIELLWPECDPDAGRNRLSQALSWLRGRLEPAGVPAHSVLAADRATVRLNPEAVSTDVVAFQAALRSAKGAPGAAERAQHLTTAVELYQGELLPGFYEEWVLQARGWLVERYVQGLDRLIVLLEEEGEVERALEYAQRAVSADALRGEGHRALIRLLAAAGQPAAALRHYHRLQEILKQELGAQPDAATRALAGEIERQAALAPPPAAALPVTEARPADSERRVAEAFPPNNLPVPLTSFIGREAEMAAVERQLSATRLLTLTGEGGCGKTRLALQVAADLLAAYRDGVWLVELAALSKPTLVPQTVASTVRVREEPGRTATEALIDYLRPRELLLALDNCEHLVGACAELAHALLRACPHLRLLATSREPLRIPGEAVWRVPSLSLPPVADGQWLMVDGPAKSKTGRSPSGPSTINRQPSTLMEYEAVRLFIERALANQPSFAVTNTNAPAVAQVCQRLDGIPLAIELAAARVGLLSVEQICARLDDRFRLLTGGTRAALPRQQTLQATMDWSYDLLSPAERVLLQRLSVFAGGFTLEAAEAVCANTRDEGKGMRHEEQTGSTSSLIPHPSSLMTEDVLDLLGRLVDKSLVQVEERGRAGGAEGASILPSGGTRGPDPGRYRLLETVRQYARDRLVGAGEVGAVRERHLQAFLQLAEQAAARSDAADAAAWLDRVRMEYDNLRGALAWSVESGEAQAGLRLGGALGHFWSARGYWTEGRERLAELLALSGASERTAARGWALAVAGRLARYQGDPKAARCFNGESLAIFRELGDKRGITAALFNLGNDARDHRDYGMAQAFYDEALAISRERNDEPQVAWAIGSLGGVASLQGDRGTARVLYEEALALFRRLDHRAGMAFALGNIADLLRQEDDPTTARRLWEESLAICRELGNKQGIAQSLTQLGWLAQSQGNPATARGLCEESLEIFRELGSQAGIAASLDYVGLAAHSQGDHEAARAIFEQSLAINRKAGSKEGTAFALHSLGNVARSQGDDGEARALYGESLAIFRELGDRRRIAESLEMFAALAAAQPQPERAARLFGAAEALREAIRAPRPVIDRADYERQVTAVRGALGEEAFAAAWAEGQALAVEQAIACALEEASNALSI